MIIIIIIIIIMMMMMMMIIIIIIIIIVIMINHKSLIVLSILQDLVIKCYFVFTRRNICSTDKRLSPVS